MSFEFTEYEADGDDPASHRYSFTNKDSKIKTLSVAKEADGLEVKIIYDPRAANAQKYIEAHTGELNIKFSDKVGTNSSSRTATVDAAGVDRIITALSSERKLSASESAYPVIEDMDAAAIKQSLRSFLTSRAHAAETRDRTSGRNP